MNPEVCFITKVIETEGMSQAMRLGAKLEHFLGYSNVWNWVLDFYEDNGYTPKLPTITDVFNDFVPEQCPEQLDFYFSEMLWRRDKARYIEYVKELTTSLKEEDRIKPVDLTSNLYKQVICSRGGSKDIDSEEEIKNAEDTIAYLKDYFKSCYPTGFERADIEFGGWGKGEFVGLMGPPYVGKTWVLLNSIDAAIRAGYKTLLVSCEMSPSRVWYRYLAYHLRIPAKRMLQGRLTDQEINDVKSKLDTIRNDGKLIIVPPSSVSGGAMDAIRRKVYEYSPDVVYIDSWKMLDPKTLYSSRWERLTELAEETKYFALEMDIPVVVTHHVGREGSKRKQGARFEDVSGSFDILGYLDICAFVASNDELRQKKQVGLLFRKVRDFEPFSFTMTFEINEGKPMKMAEKVWVLETAQREKGDFLSDSEVDNIVEEGFF